jgi:cell division septation protein DedD
LAISAELGALAATPLSAQSVKSGIEAWQRSDYAAAVAIWRPLAEKGDADAAFNLGQAYRLGRGVTLNLGAAQSWFERAAQKGHVDAQATLGLLLFQNGNQPEGLKWLKAAAEQGEARSLLVYGTALFNGDNVTQDPILGYAYVSRAAAQGLAPARETLAQLDKLLPLEDRKKGLAIAMAKARTAPPPSAKPANAKAKAVQVAEAKASPTKLTPAPAPATTKVAAASPPTGNWRIQLGAFAQKGSAEALYRKLASNSALAGRQPYYVAAGAVTRLQAGPFASRSAAQAACTALKQACFPVPAK